MSKALGPTAQGKSFAHGGFYTANVVSIANNTNWIQVQFYAYGDAIPKERTEWVSVGQHNPQVPGDTATQPYHVGSTVVLAPLDDFHYTVLWAVPGTDGEKRIGKSGEPDSTPNQYPDVPVHQRGPETGGKTLATVIRGSDAHPQGSFPDAKHIFNYGPNGEVYHRAKRHLFKYALGKGGEPPAPFGEGTPAYLNQLKGIFNGKLGYASDVLPTILKEDGNFSGAIQEGVQLILNMRNGGYGTGQGVMGSGAISAAMTQFNNVFGGIPILNNLMSGIGGLTGLMGMVQGMIPSNLRGSQEQLASQADILANDNMGVDTNTLRIIQEIIDDLVAIGDAITDPVARDYITRLQDTMRGAMQQAVANTMTNTNDQLGTLLTGANRSIVGLLGGPVAIQNMIDNLTRLGAAAGLPNAALLALLSSLLLNLQTANNAPSSSSSSSSSAAGQDIGSMIGQLNTFMHNPIAVKEIMGGGIIQQFLNKNPIKYEPAERNKVKTKHATEKSGVDVTIAMTKDYKDKSAIEFYPSDDNTSKVF